MLANPRKAFRYALEIDGVNMFLVQEVDSPEVELAEILHGAPGNLPDAKTPGKMSVGDLVVRKLKPTDYADTWAWDWFASAAAGLKKDFMKVGFLTELGTDAMIPVQRFFLGNIWVKKISTSGFGAQKNENTIETVTFSVQFFYPTDSPQFTALFGGAGAVAGGLPFTQGKP